MDKNEIPIDIFLDLSKAFDTIDHTIVGVRITQSITRKS